MQYCTLQPVLCKLCGQALFVLHAEQATTLGQQPCSSASIKPADALTSLHLKTSPFDTLKIWLAASGVVDVNTAACRSIKVLVTSW